MNKYSKFKYLVYIILAGGVVASIFIFSFQFYLIKKDISNSYTSQNLQLSIPIKLSKGESQGYFDLDKDGINVILNKSKQYSYSCKHLKAPFDFSTITFTIKQSNAGSLILKRKGKTIKFWKIGTYNIDLSDASDVYINFWNNDYVSEYQFNNTYSPYRSGFIHFTVSVNQNIITSYSDCSNSLTDTNDNLVDVDCVLKLPVTYKEYGRKSKLLMICHGAGNGVTSVQGIDKGWEDIADYNNLIDTFVNAGYAVFDCNGYDNTIFGVNFWGSPKGVEAWRKAYDYIINNYNVEHNFSIYGFSMGGLTALNLVTNKFPNIKAVALGSPVLDLEKSWEDGQVKLMQLGFGLGSKYDKTFTIGCDPMQKIVKINGSEYYNANVPPVKIWYGSTEVGTCVNKEYAKRIVNAITNGGGSAYYREVENAGHEICYGHNDNINKEILYFFERFN